MALLIDNRPEGHGGQIAADLLAAMDRVNADMGISGEADAVFDLVRSRRNIGLRAQLAARGLVLPAIETSEHAIPTPVSELTLRTYNPGSVGPVIVFVHGGGWMAGSVDSHDSMARWFVAETGAMLVAPAYGLAPEHPFPHAVIEVAAAIAAVAREIAPGRPLFVMGDSAGANIAAMALLRLSPGERARIAGFVSIYGAYAPAMGLSSHRLYGDGRFGLSEARMRWCWTLYAPQLFPDHLDQMTPLGRDLSDFPPTLCIGAECDVLLDDSMSFYSRLAAATVDVSLSLWPGLPHGCLHYVGVVDSVTKAARSIVRYIAQRRPALRAVSPGPAPSPGDLGALPAERLKDVAPLFAARSRGLGAVAHGLAMDILEGKLVPGQVLPTEENASAALGISRSAYREAMRTLTAKGLVTALPKVGTRIAPRESWTILDPDVLAWSLEAEPDDKFIRDLFELRGLVGPDTAAMAAVRRDDADLARLADALSLLAAASPDTLAWLDAAIDYHRAVLRASGNDAVSGLWPAIQATLSWSVKLQMMLPTSRLGHDPLADHARVFDHVKAQNGDEARAAMADLVKASLAETLASLARVQRARRAASEATLD
jgi:acetyl esterase/lipase/DNA-binding FadR family transcriptional regulator